MIKGKVDKAESVEKFSTDSALDFLEVIPIQSVPFWGVHYGAVYSKNYTYFPGSKITAYDIMLGYI